jgi:choline kinase
MKPRASHQAVHTALVLAAGNGDRFKHPFKQSKLLEPILGRPIILRTIDTAVEAGILAFEIVLGYQADRVRDLIERFAPKTARVRFTFNPRWDLENGVSALAPRERLVDSSGSRFALLMGDHLFESDTLAALLHTPVAEEEWLLAIDSRRASTAVTAEATKVRLDETHVVEIGKELQDFDALDTGMFVGGPSLFGALTQAQATGDTTLSGGIRVLARRGLMRGVDIGDARWFDIDTMSDLEAAESLLAELSAHQ